jgi:hypothetical protein
MSGVNFNDSSQQSVSTGDSGLSALAITRLATVTGIDFKTTGQTTLYAVPSNYTCIVTDIILRITDSSGFSVAPVVRVGKASGYSEFVGNTTLTGLDAVNEYVSLASAANLGIHSSFASTAGIDVGGVLWTNSDGSNAVALTIGRDDSQNWPGGSLVFPTSSSSSGGVLTDITWSYKNGATAADFQYYITNTGGWPNLAAAGGTPNLANSASVGPTNIPINSSGGVIETIKLDITTGATATTLTGAAYVLGYLL